MLNKTETSAKYLATLKDKLSRNQDSIQWNSKISAFLINENRISEALPYLLKIIELSTTDQYVKNKIADLIPKLHIEKDAQSANDKYAAVRKTTVFSSSTNDYVDVPTSARVVHDEDPDLKSAMYYPSETGSSQLRQSGNKVPHQTEMPKTVLLTRRRGEQLRIGNDIHVSIPEILENDVRLVINVPKNTTVAYDDSYLKICESNRTAVAANKEKLIAILSKAKFHNEQRSMNVF